MMCCCALVPQDWNTPGKMWCDGPRQEAVFKACSHKGGSSSNKSTSSMPLARGMPVAAVTSSNGSGSGSGGSDGAGGGAIHVVPAGSSHGSFTDLPFLINPWMSNQLRRLVSLVLCWPPAVLLLWSAACLLT